LRAAVDRARRARLVRRLGVVLHVRSRPHDLARPRRLLERDARRRGLPRPRGRDASSSATRAAVACGAPGVLVWALGSLHGDGEFRRARRLIEQLGLLTILVALVPLGFLNHFGRWGGPG